MLTAKFYLRICYTCLAIVWGAIPIGAFLHTLPKETACRVAEILIPWFVFPSFVIGIATLFLADAKDKRERKEAQRAEREWLANIIARLQ